LEAVLTLSFACRLIYAQPANIFLCANDALKIGDLGIAKALTQVSFTRTQVGTPLYMAPEVRASVKTTASRNRC
jgi:serine/threonine protein kinase